LKNSAGPPLRLETVIRHAAGAIIADGVSSIVFIVSLN
jgi:hypothetical protein